MAPRGARRREPVCGSGGIPRVSKRRKRDRARTTQQIRSTRRDASQSRDEPETIAAARPTLPRCTGAWRRRGRSLSPPRRLRACQTGAAVANGEAVQRCSAEIQIALSRTSRHAVASRSRRRSRTGNLPAAARKSKSRSRRRLFYDVREITDHVSYHVITSRTTHETTARNEERTCVSTPLSTTTLDPGGRPSVHVPSRDKTQVASRDAERPWTAGRARTAARRDAPPRAGGAGRFVPRSCRPRSPVRSPPPPLRARTVL